MSGQKEPVSWHKDLEKVALVVNNYYFCYMSSCYGKYISLHIVTYSCQWGSSSQFAHVVEFVVVGFIIKHACLKQDSIH